MNRRKAGFTLIELLIVIGIMIMLVTLLLPAISKAQLLIYAVQTRAQIAAITKGCMGYSTIYNDVPGPIGDAPNNPKGAGRTPMYSGCQSLRMALMGCTYNSASGTFTGLTTGPYDVIDASAYATSTHRAVFHKPKREELLNHAALMAQGGYFNDPSNSYDPNIEVLVDFRFQPARPLLYFRKRTIMNTSGGQTGFFGFPDNAAYCQSGEQKVQTITQNLQVVGGAGAGSGMAQNVYSSTIDELYAWIGPAGQPNEFVIISAGLDRVFFSSDDLCSFNK